MERARGFVPVATIFATSWAIVLVVFAETTVSPTPQPSDPSLAAAATSSRPEVAELVDATLKETALRGTTLDGALRLDAHGRFTRDRHALALFDHLFTLRGEHSVEEIRALIVEVIGHQLDGRAADDAVAFLDQYLTYQRTVSERSEFALADAPAERLAISKGARRDAFGDEAAAELFGEEEALKVFSLELRALAQDHSLTPERRAERQRELAHNLRDAWGDGFRGRLLEWRAKRDRVLQDTQMDEAQKLRALDEHMLAHFTEFERLRVHALDEHGITP
ncbi:MAG: lipase secretion chaperone [Myxococcota bacterium]